MMSCTCVCLRFRCALWIIVASLMLPMFSPFIKTGTCDIPSFFIVIISSRMGSEGLADIMLAFIMLLHLGFRWPRASTAIIRFTVESLGSTFSASILATWAWLTPASLASSAWE